MRRQGSGSAAQPLENGPVRFRAWVMVMSGRVAETERGMGARRVAGTWRGVVALRVARACRVVVARARRVIVARAWRVVMAIGVVKAWRVFAAKRRVCAVREL